MPMRNNKLGFSLFIFLSENIEKSSKEQVVTKQLIPFYFGFMNTELHS